MKRKPSVPICLGGKELDLWELYHPQMPYHALLDDSEQILDFIVLK